MRLEPKDKITLVGNLMNGADCVSISAQADSLGEVLDLFRRFLAACGYGDGVVSFKHAQEIFMQHGERQE